jgi:hypothetical protein
LIEVIKKVDFISRAHSLYMSEGVFSYVDVAHLLLQLNVSVKSIAKGIFHNFHVPERSLYLPLKEVFDTHLPTSAFVNIENNLYKTANPLLKTDISISKISQLGSARKSRDRECTHFIEMKSVFYGDTISSSDVEHDLEKLLACESAYGAVCFFVLVGLESELEKHKRKLTTLGTMSLNTDPFKVTLRSKSLWLRPAGSYTADDPFVYVWEVSSTDKFKSGRHSGCAFSIFQSNDPTHKFTKK